MNSDDWRDGYTGGRKDILHTDEETHRVRLHTMGIDRLPTSSALLDLGCGDGNLLDWLQRHGYEDCRGIEPDAALVEHSPMRERITVGIAQELPWPDASFDGVIAMAVLHHLPGDADLTRTLAEVYRVLRPGGLFTFCEPTLTVARRLLTVLLLSPLAGASRFARAKRAMVLEEWDTLNWWLSIERSLPDRVRAGGFTEVHMRRDLLKSYLTAWKPEG